LAFTFQPLRRLFEKITNRVFYQDRYETQDVLDGVGSVIVRTISIESLVHDSLKIILKSLKPEFISVLLIDSKNSSEFRHFSVGKKVSIDILLPIASELSTENKSILIHDEIESTESHTYKLLQTANISVIARLDTSKDSIGYIVFGQKVSGSIYSSQDIDLIKITADELAIAIQNALRYEEIAHFNETLQEKIKIATAQLRENNKKLQALDDAKDEFISMASHQLRTPLTSVKGYLSMVLDGDVGDLKDKQRKLLQDAFASSQRMVYLVSDFLNVSRIQTGKFMLEKQLTNLADVVQSEIEQIRTTADQSGLKIEYQKPETFPVLNLDMYKLRQVVMNFLENAIFYSRPGGTIKVELTNNGQDVVLKIKDQGIGVPASERHQLFSKFYRATNARKVRPDGTGIGLFMAKKVIVSHDGAVIFESTEDKGSTFGFRIPLASAAVKKPGGSLQTAARR
jgi:signal transduction histidine kinase